MNMDTYHALDFKEKMWVDLITEILAEQRRQTDLLSEFVDIMKKADRELENV